MVTMTEQPDLPHAPEPVPDDISPEMVTYREKWINRFTAIIFGVVIFSAGILILAVVIRVARAIAGF